ncbi:MAG: hypothetical protein A2722_03575 [Candidatus Doudnabacteria bacterium RIFCSPHIGHO2_01_FULL_50_11]|uniref:Uncharacterized protein n=1 Tax=Candidatus Doudnabacteria bacterium RIFCSPHIGHO2_01_FULL_50_11 TaxID=1817828 RepID=A0A1F5PIM8_9BACT|nr:MAG: hypothetical protein A2722_03575 [Candidatus Doudnabacteria bacterium RIFCSPHIGHO2_01_FULL_50_11]
MHAWLYRNKHRIVKIIIVIAILAVAEAAWYFLFVRNLVLPQIYSVPGSIPASTPERGAHADEEGAPSSPKPQVKFKSDRLPQDVTTTVDKIVVP